MRGKKKYMKRNHK